MPVIETKEYADGTTATGVAPLPDLSPAEQDAINPAPITASDLLSAMKQMSADNRDAMIAAVQEMKKPSAEEQAKADAERAQLLAQTERRVAAAKEQEAEIAARRENCSHLMPNGQTNFRGQVLSNGWAAVFCSHCHSTYTFEATEVERTQSGLNVDKWGPNAHSIIQNRVKMSVGKVPPPVPRVPAGATILFN